MNEVQSTASVVTWVVWLVCGCVVDDDDAAAGATIGETWTGSPNSSDGATDVRFDAARWIGRYHFENPFFAFGEPSDPQGGSSLVNFEILPDARAVLVYDRCASDETFTITYEWTPPGGDLPVDGWLSLRRGPDETSLRFLRNKKVQTLRVQLVEPCRELRFEVDGFDVTGFTIRPGESCWVDRCTTPGRMHIDYCEGEEPLPCP